MDIPRKSQKEKRLLRRIIGGVLLIGLIIAGTIGLSRLEPAAPGVERETLLTDAVKQGNMILEVRGVGTLVSEDMLVVPATVPGRVKCICVQPGVVVEPNTVILELTNPDLQLAWLNAQTSLKSAQAQFRAKEAQLQDDVMGQEASLARTRADLNNARLRLKVDDQQHKDGLISDLAMSLSQSNVEQLENLLTIQEKRFSVFKDTILPAQLDAAQASVEQAQSQYNLAKNEVDALFVRAGVAGVLAPIKTRIEPGEQVGAGQVLARITNPERLKAQLQIPQGQARDVYIGLPAEIDTYNGVIKGNVSRIEPTVMEGNVSVDVSLNGALPRGARPDLSVVGTIEIARLENILYVGRPVMASADSRAELFKLLSDGKHAARVLVQFGRTSVSTIEVIEGLAVGDEVILSDMSQWDTVDRVRLK